LLIYYQKYTPTFFGDFAYWVGTISYHIYVFQILRFIDVKDRNRVVFCIGKDFGQ